MSRYTAQLHTSPNKAGYYLGHIRSSHLELKNMNWTMFLLQYNALKQSWNPFYSIVVSWFASI